MDAYDLMSIVKKQGAAAKNLQAWKDYQSELAAYREKKGRGGFGEVLLHLQWEWLCLTFSLLLLAQA